MSFSKRNQLLYIILYISITSTVSIVGFLLLKIFTSDDIFVSRVNDFYYLKEIFEILLVSFMIYINYLLNKYFFYNKIKLKKVKSGIDDKVFSMYVKSYCIYGLIVLMSEHLFIEFYDSIHTVYFKSLILVNLIIYSNFKYNYLLFEKGLDVNIKEDYLKNNNKYIYLVTIFKIIFSLLIMFNIQSGVMFYTYFYVINSIIDAVLYSFLLKYYVNYYNEKLLH